MFVCEHCGQHHGDTHRYCPTTGKLLAPHRFFAPGTLIGGKYRIGSLLGTGGIAAVFAATHVLLDKQMAVKLMLPELSRDREMAARMAREAQAASATGHPNIALVTDMGWSEQGSMYIVMELLAGQTMGEIVREQAPLPVARAVRLICQLLEGLTAVHERGIVHRDIKPDNIMVVDGEEGELVKILDFGISKFLDDDELRQSLTNTGVILGTPCFMSPEQARGARDVDQRTDVYAAGGVLYSLLTGQRPFSADDHPAMLAQILEGQIVPPSAIEPAIVPALDALILKALCRDPAGRFDDAASFRRALEPHRRDDPARVPRSQPAGITAEPLELLSLVDLDQRRQDGHAATAPAVPPAAAAPRPLAEEPSEPSEATNRDDHLFAPPVEDDRPLELDTAMVRRQLAAEESAGLEESAATMHLPRRSGRLLRTARSALVPLAGLGVLLVAVLLVLDWVSGDGGGGRSTEASDAVLILVETEPRDARILVDGVQQVSGSIQLPRSGRTFAIRVEKPGHVAQTLQLTADRSQALRVTLRERPPRY